MICVNCSFVYKSGPQDTKCPKCGAYEASAGMDRDPKKFYPAEARVIKCASREEWLEARKSLVTATDVAAILGLSDWATPWKIQQQKLNPEWENPPPTEEQETGNDLQPYIGRMYTKKTGIALTEWPDFTLSVHENGWAACTPDFVYADGRPIDVDAKHVGQHRLKEFGEEGTDKVPADMVCQAIWSMYVRDLKEWHPAVLCGGKKRIYRIVRDRDTEARVVAEVTTWREKHLVQKVPVQVDGSTAASAWVDKKFKKGQAVTMRASEEADRLLAVLAECKRAEARKAETINRLKAIMGTATRLESEEYGYITWSAGGSKDVEEFDEKKFMKMLEEKYPKAVKTAREICTSTAKKDVSRRFEYHPREEE